QRRRSQPRTNGASQQGLERCAPRARPARPRRSDGSRPKLRTTIDSARHSCATLGYIEGAISRFEFFGRWETSQCRQSEASRLSTADEGTGSTFRCYRQRGTRTGGGAMRKQKFRKRKLGNANAGGPDRHEKARAVLTGAGRSHTSRTRRVRHCWLADIDVAPAFVRHTHAVSWTAGDDTSRLHDPR